MPAGAQLRTAIADERYDGATPEPAMRLTKPTGATFVRITLNWHDVAFAGPGPDPSNPANDAYNWATADGQIRSAANNGLEPIVIVMRAPPWAHDGGLPAGTSTNPNPVAYRQFAEAVARRYSGSFVPDGGTALPRVRYWMAWNEPNRRYFLMPQFDGTTLRSPEIYRPLVNALADGVRAVDFPPGEPPNLVIAGGLAPLGITGSPSPMRFMRALLADGKPQVKFDIWSHHPYTSGGPTHKASGSGNVALGNLRTMRKLLNERFRAGRIDSTTSKAPFWVTEFGWDTKPPDKHRYALPTGLHARWTAEALYRMWRNGISLVTWFKLRDNPFKLSRYQSGLYTVNGTRKRSFRAFRFPTVALRQPGRILIWGRTPKSTPGRVVIQIRVAKRWRKLTTLTANANGIFTRSLRTPYRSGSIRAKHGGDTSLGFSLTPVADRYVNPFGCGGGSSCT